MANKRQAARGMKGADSSRDKSGRRRVRDTLCYIYYANYTVSKKNRKRKVPSFITELAFGFKGRCGGGFLWLLRFFRRLELLKACCVSVRTLTTDHNSCFTSAGRSQIFAMTSAGQIYRHNVCQDKGTRGSGALFLYRN